MQNVETDSLFLKLFLLASAALMLLLLPSLTNGTGKCFACVLSRRHVFILNKTALYRRDRTVSALAFMPAFVGIVAGYGLYAPEWLIRLSASLGFDWSGSFAVRLCSISAVFAAWLLVRLCFRLAFRPKGLDDDRLNCFITVPWTFFVALTATMVATVGILRLFGVGNDIVTAVLLWEIGGFYALCLYRKTQIFTYYRNIFSAFLYLCTLEILPAGLLIASALF